MDRKLEKAAEWVREADRLLVFTGAGVSAESGIPTFRDDDGFWRNFPPNLFATWRGLLLVSILNPRRFAAFLQAVIQPIARACPNAAHFAIAAAEQYVQVTVVTQNVDGLHQEAGSTNVQEIHGSFLEIITRPGQRTSLVERRELQRICFSLIETGRSFFILARVISSLKRIAGFGRQGVYYPNLVLFGDSLAEPAWTNAVEAALHADCVVKIGCSGVVEPAARLPSIARDLGARIIANDPRESDGDIWLQGTAAHVTPKLFTAAFGSLESAKP